MYISSDQPTVANPALQPAKTTIRRMPSIPAPPRAAYPARPLPQKKKRARKRWLLLIPATVFSFLMSVVLVIVVMMSSIYGKGILPGVQVGDIAIGSMSKAEAIAILNSEWNSFTLRDGERTWQVLAADLGIELNAEQTVENAYAEGRESGNFLNALLSDVVVEPVVSINSVTAEAELNRLSDAVYIAPVDAGVAFVEGRVVATPPQNGRALNVAGTLQSLLAPGAWTQTTIDLHMLEISPTIIDASAMLAEAERLLSHSLDITVFDPVTGDQVIWSLSPEHWSQWLSASTNPDSPSGLTFTMNPDGLRDYLTAQTNNALDASRSLDIEAAVSSMQNAVSNGQPGAAFAQVQHQPRTHTVQAGESITSIAWDYGIPYLYIQEANNNLKGVSVGQVISIPPADKFLTLPVVPHKRIVVSISQQRTWVYENGALKWEWASSTGIPDSPTWPGIYQILSHEPNAYAGNWDLWMPNFLGVYQPIPGSGFTNGFHGFPTRGGGQLLWENSLGRKVTYGCVLLSDTNVQQLYAWAENGVVVEIQA